MLTAASALWIWVSGLLFALLHSLLAAKRCKQWCYAHGLQEPRYRLIYSLLALVTTALWAHFVHQLPDQPLYRSDGALFVLLLTLQLVGGVLVLAAFLPIDGLVFLGLKRAEAGGEPFLERGVYRYLRHPMYSGAMLILLAMPEQSWNGLHFGLVICLYFIVGARLEEARMVADHPEYADYRARVPAFLPLMFLRR